MHSITPQAARLEMLLSELPQTTPQRDRAFRALTELDCYQVEDHSAFYSEPAYRVKSLSGGSYLVFGNSCSCMDWNKRGPVGTGEIARCKHEIALRLKGCFQALPVSSPSAPAYTPRKTREEISAEWDAA
jgi:hypothetical protein